MRLVIDRRKWYRGHGGFASNLLSRDGTMCCLGFLGRACGATVHALRDQIRPLYCIGRQKKPFKGLFDDMAYGRVGASAFINANDTGGGGEVRREKLLTKLFAEHGVEVEFIN